DGKGAHGTVIKLAAFVVVEPHPGALVPFEGGAHEASPLGVKAIEREERGKGIFDAAPGAVGLIASIALKWNVSSVRPAAIGEPCRGPLFPQIMLEYGPADQANPLWA